MREMSVAEQRYQAVIGDGRTVKEVAGQWNVSGQAVHSWLARYEAEGVDGTSSGEIRKKHAARASGRL